MDLSKYPPEIIVAIERFKTYHFENSLNYIINELGLMEEFKSLPEGKNKEDMLYFFKMIFIYGFYSGISLYLDPQMFSDKPIEVPKEIADKVKPELSEEDKFVSKYLDSVLQIADNS